MKKISLGFAILLLVVITFCAFYAKPGSNKSSSYANSIGDNNEATPIKQITPSLKNSKGFISEMGNLTKAVVPENILYKGKAVVLTYHHISEEKFTKITIKPERFEEDLKMLRSRGFNVISLREMIDAMEGKISMPDNAVVITFDDGIESFYNYAYPLLMKYNMPATNFIITSRNETYMNFTNQDKPLSPDEITRMFSSGKIDIQSHTNDSHEFVYINSELKKGPKLTNRIYDRSSGTLENESDYDKRITEDLLKSRELIHKYNGVYPDILCFPFGIYNKHVIELARNCGFKYFVTTHPGVNRSNSKSTRILRIRAGDEDLNSEKLYSNIIHISANKKAH